MCIRDRDTLEYHKDGNPIYHTLCPYSWVCWTRRLDSYKICVLCPHIQSTWWGWVSFCPSLYKNRVRVHWHCTNFPQSKSHMSPWIHLRVLLLPDFHGSILRFLWWCRNYLRLTSNHWYALWCESKPSKILQHMKLSFSNKLLFPQRKYFLYENFI